MSYFHFTCGHFTTGKGHYINSSKMVSADILEKLEENGEKNCNVIIKRHTYPFTCLDDIMDADNDDFSYVITSRWYTSLTKVKTIMSLAASISAVKSYFTED